MAIYINPYISIIHVGRYFFEYTATCTQTKRVQIFSYPHPKPFDLFMKHFTAFYFVIFLLMTDEPSL